MRSTFVSRHQDMRGLLEVLAEEVSKGVSSFSKMKSEVLEVPCRF